MFDLDKEIRSSKPESESQKDNPHEIYFKIKEEKTKTESIFNNRLFLKSALAISLIVIFVMTLIMITHKPQMNDITINFGNPDGNLVGSVDQTKFAQVEDISTLKNLLNSSSDSLDGEFSVEGDAPTVSAPGADVSGEYTTNTQVSGIDEADIVKVKGDYIFYLSKAQRIYDYDTSKYIEFGVTALNILKTDGSNVEIVKQITFDAKKEVVAENSDAKLVDASTFYPSDLFCTDRYIIVTVSRSVKRYVEYNNSVRTKNYSYFNEYYIYDINTYEKVTSISVPGSNVSTRLIGDELYIVNQYNSFGNDDDLLIPRYGINDEFYEASLNNFYYCPHLAGKLTRYIVIFKVTLTDKINVEDLYFLSAALKTIYVSHNAIYLIDYSVSNGFNDNETKTKYTTTNITEIRIKDGFSLGGVITVKGSVNDKYWIDEYDGYLRVASTGVKTTYKTIAGIYEYGQVTSNFNAITIFEKNSDGLWQNVGYISDGLGEVGESMKSARFNEKEVTVVTFRQTDPLYYIDLTDPKNPVIKSELKISGFSVYQHPYLDDYIIGIGYEANNNGVTNGFKVTLFDVSDKSNIKQVGNSLKYSYSNYHSATVLSNPKALFLDLNRGIFGFNIRDYEGNNLFMIYKIDLSLDYPLYVMDRCIKSDDNARNYRDIIDRMVYVGDYYYLLTIDEVKVYKLNDNSLTHIGDVSLI